MSRLDRSFMRAQAAQNRFEARGGTGPEGPLFRWLALLEIEHRLRQQFEAGDRMALFAAMRKCAVHGLVMPRWVALEFIRGYGPVLRCEVDSWDDPAAFGLPYGRRKKAQLVGMKRRRNLLIPAYHAVREMSAQGHPIDATTFAVVAEQLGTNGTEVGKLYYAFSRLTRNRHEIA
jgi:hypothetical protein